MNPQFPTTSTRLKIVVLGARGFPNVQGGVETHCERLYPFMAKKGCEVIVLTRKPYVDLNLDTYEGVRLISLPCLRNKFLETFLHTFIGVFVAKKFFPDIMHIHAIGPSLFIPLARILGLKVVMTHHGPDYQRKKWGKLAKIILKLGEQFGCKWANSIICISEAIADGVRKRYNRESVVIPNGVIIPEILQSDGTLRRYGLTRGKYILSVGRFVPEKGFHDLIDAFNELKTQDIKLRTPNPESIADHWKLVIVGRPDHEDRYSQGLKEKASQNGDIVLTGFLSGEPLQELYSHAGLFVLPSYYEGLPIVLLEALSYGLSCIASNIPGNREVGLSDNRFFMAGNVELLASKIKEFINIPLNEEERKAQRDLIAERYDWGRIADRTMEIYMAAGRKLSIAD